VGRVAATNILALKQGSLAGISSVEVRPGASQELAPFRRG
jgi:hypothetical protein